MAKDSKIQWTDNSWNPWHGCKKVSPGCKYCYMFRDKNRYGQNPATVLRSKTTFKDPLKWSFEMQVGGIPPKGRDKIKGFSGMKIFTCSWSDYFIGEADAWRSEAWRIIKDTPEFTYQILTKRLERIPDCLPPDWGGGYRNVWLGVSIESEKQKHRLKTLSQIPAQCRFVSFEPLIGPITLSQPEAVHWVIIGGESGNETGKYRYRECRLAWT